MFGTLLVSALDEVRVVVPGEVGSGTVDDFVDLGDVVLVEICDGGMGCRPKKLRCLAQFLPHRLLV